MLTDRQQSLSFLPRVSLQPRSPAQAREWEEPFLNMAPSGEAALTTFSYQMGRGGNIYPSGRAGSNKQA